MSDGLNEKIVTKEEANIMRERGRRVKQLRSMAMLKSNELAHRAGVSRIAISYWENARHSGLTKEGARKVIEAIQKEGIVCTFEWLWQGKGNEPQFMTNNNTPSSIQENVRHLIPSIEREIEFFLNANKDGVIAKIETNSMSPTFEFNDIVGGIWQPLEALKFDGYCILQINQITHVEWIKKMEYTQLPQKEKIKNELIKIAPIIRVWRS